MYPAPFLFSSVSKCHPTDSDVRGFCTGLGIVFPDSFSFSGMAESASLAFEQRTGWIPFLQESTATTRTYDPPGRRSFNRNWNNLRGGDKIVQLQAGICTEQALVSVSVIGFSNLTLSQDFRLLPQNAPARRIAYERIEFSTPQWGAPDSISVTAFFGRCQSLPQDVYDAELRYAAALAIESYNEGQMAGGEQSQKEGDEASTLDPVLLRTSGAIFRKEFDRVAGRYSRVSVGL